MTIRFLAIVDAGSLPIYFRSVPPTSPEIELNRQFVAEMALDFVHGPDMSPKPVLTLVHDGLAVYCVVLNTRVKVMLGISALELEPELENISKLVIDAYVNHICNPFYSPEQPNIKSPQFEKEINNILEGSSA